LIKISDSSLTSPTSTYKWFALIVIVYMINISVNDIWTPNESFYADAVREMFESGDFLDIQYNYEPRYNKPPLTYWLMAGSSAIFGINEFGLRLPIVLLALGSIWYTFLLGRHLYGPKGGLYAMLIMAVSAQLLAVKQYASPEIPLTFFFTASLYYFLKGYKERNFRNILLFYILLAMAVLVKGYPYIIVIGGIVGLYVLLDHSLRIKEIWKELRFLKPVLGLTLVLLIGLSWVFYMYLTEGQEFWEVYKRETFDRAFTRKERSMRPFFYFEVMAWTILPFSIAFYYAAIKWIKDYKSAKKVLFPASWIIVMLVIFTISKGKIPTYFIQAHTAMALLIVPLLLKGLPNNKLWRFLWSLTFIFPSILIAGAICFAVYQLEMSIAFYAFAITGILTLVWGLKSVSSTKLVIVPFLVTIQFLIVFASFLPKLEKFRPYDEIGEMIDKKTDKDAPLLIEGTLIQNMPYYSKRKVIRDATVNQIIHNQGKTLALVKSEKLTETEGFETLWTGLIYDFPSESQFAKFITASLNAMKGDSSKFAEYQLIYRN